MKNREWMERKKKCSSDKWAAGRKGKGRMREDKERKGKKESLERGKRRFRGKARG